MNRAIVISAPGQVRVLEIPMPARKRGEALLRLLWGGICGSDLGTYRGTYAYVTYPRIPGHELAAEIVAIDRNEHGLSEGDIVTVNPYFNCGSCYSCQRGLVNCCMSNETLGCQRDGAFSSYFSMPVERLYPGKGLDPQTLALIEPFCISYHGVQRALPAPKENVLILGGGTIGALALLAAKRTGATVFVSDVAPGKLEVAKVLGADGVILNDSPESFASQVRSLTAGNGFDAVIEAVGLPSTFQNSIDAAAFGGRVVLIGIGKSNLDFNFTVIQKKELSVFGSRNALKADFLHLIDVAAKEDLPLGRLITNTYPMQDAAQAFSDFDRNQGGMLKVLLDFRTT
jgi:2-desacetyl-2-hydroxyethyl bacteriochlorophyllide A dehydrogenase